MSAELPFMRKLMLALSLQSIRVWRQNCGSVPIRDTNGKVQRYFHAGPPNGAADLSGIVSPEGYRLEVETKSDDGEQEHEQIAWMQMIRSMGGIYVLCKPSPILSDVDNVNLSVQRIQKAIERRRKHREYQDPRTLRPD